METFSKAPAKDILDKVYYTDFMTRVPGDFSVKMDVATMANSLQARSPFLDVKILEFIAQLPPRFKLHKGITKYILKKAFKNILPPEITARRQKQGFSIPIDKWCRWDWKRYLEENLFSPKAIARGYFDKESLKRLFEEHFTGICNHGDRLWTLLVLEVWHRMYIDKEPF
ncbi:asparagine synthase C-terminal domain-containing protein [bacterium]|nr:asparagine synthase C-terminal domain-containing protein [bacterium]